MMERLMELRVDAIRASEYTPDDAEQIEPERLSATGIPSPLEPANRRDEKV
jgi:hypothetical protein